MKSKLQLEHFQFFLKFAKFIEFYDECALFQTAHIPFLASDPLNYDSYLDG